jgi:hypothetical protein
VDVLKETYFQRGVGSSIATRIIGRVRSGQITMNEQCLKSVNSLRARVNVKFRDPVPRTRSTKSVKTHLARKFLFYTYGEDLEVMRYTPVRRTPVRRTPVRCTPMRCTPVMHACEMHAREMHAHEVYTHRMHAYEVTPMVCTPMRYTPVRYTPVRYTPVRYTPMRS